MLMIMVLVIFSFFVAVPLVMALVGISLSGPRYRGPVTDHFDGKRFRNPGNAKAKGGLEVLKWMLTRKAGAWRTGFTESYGQRPLGHFRDGIRITFVNHSTFLIQVDGVNILTDPVWSERASPFSWLGPKRVKSPGIRFEDLPAIHVVLITHNHYDHLDVRTMRTIFGAHHPRIVTPLGIKTFLTACYVGGATEIDWWEEIELQNRLKVQAVPAQHFSGRGFLDRDATLWCGYVLKTTAGNIYFAGDTGYNYGTFKEIAARCGPMRVSMLPIGAYKPAWFMSPIHVSPEEAITIHQDVGSERSIGMHFGTFPLADDGCDDPVNDLGYAIEKSELKPDEFIVLKEGEAMVLE